MSRNEKEPRGVTICDAVCVQYKYCVNMCSFGARLQNSGLATTFTVVHELSFQQYEIK